MSSHVWEHEINGTWADEQFRCCVLSHVTPRENCERIGMNDDEVFSIIKRKSQVVLVMQGQKKT